ncbi:hypothetical protein L1049_004974 [Liquidambar formosana]|uniref:Uncharacterized protein n=1 Tax=Liquidambar formosana TaxID=63359 RepID=A0AAP0RTI7_LIQFO
MMNSLSAGTGFEGTPFEDAFGGIWSTKNKDVNFHETLAKTTTTHHSKTDEGGTGGGGGGNDGLTRDFLGLRALSHSDILNIAGLGNCINTSHEHHNHNQKSWQG